MQYRKWMTLWPAIVPALLLIGSVAAQPAKTTKTQRPTKFPTQFDKIIDPDDKASGSQEPKDQPAQQAAPQVALNEALIKAVDALTVQVRSLVDEVKAGNARQQINTEVVRMSRFDLRIDRYESELKTVRDRLVTLENDYQSLLGAVTPEGLEQQVSRMPYASKTEAIARVKEAAENRLRLVSNERDLVKRRETELTAILSALRDISTETEKRLMALEETIRKAQPEATPAKPDAPDLR